MRPSLRPSRGVPVLRCASRLGASLVLLVVAVASADAQGSRPPAPRCRDVRCTRTREPSGDDSLAVLLLRAPLLHLRLVVRTASELLLLAPKLEDEYQLSRRVEDVFFDDTHTFGVYPTAFVETGLEPNVGARLVHRDLFRARERLQLRAAFGGARNQVYGVDLHSGNRWRRLRIELRARLRWREGQRFYGVGNDDLVEPAIVTRRFEPSERAIATEFGKRELLLRGGAAWQAGAVRVGLYQLWRQRKLWDDGGDTPEVERVYAGESVALFDHPLVDVYDELRIALDQHRRGRAGSPLRSSGTAVTVWTGVQHRLDAPQVSFGRIGFDLQPLIDLYRGDRVLRLRVRSAWVIGELERVPFLDLPYLGGASLLRGYDGARFRGLGTVLASAEYRYPVQPNLSGYLFVDAGRAYLQLAQLDGSSLRGLRVGFGGGLYAFTTDALLLRVQLASSIDGGLFFALRVDTADALGETY